MSRLLDLYPAAWRQRYGDEMLALLAEQPPTVLDRLDVIRGAVDAHLHPQVRGQAAAPDKEHPVDRRLLGAMAAVGGLAWLIGFATLFVMPSDEYGDPDSTLAFIAAMLAIPFIGIALGELGTRPGSESSRRTGHLIGGACVLTVGTMFFPWPIFVIGLFVFPIIGILASIRGLQNGALPGWYVIVFVVAAVASMAGFLGGISQPAAVAAMISLGVSGLALAWLALRTELPRPSAPEVGAT